MTASLPRATAVATLTLDTNCLIALESGELLAKAVAAMHELHVAGQLRLAVVAVIASENGRRGDGAVEVLKQGLSARGWGSVEVLAPASTWGLTYWDHGRLIDAAEDAILRHMWEILFPGISQDYTKYCRQRGLAIDEQNLDPKWVNRMCDVLTIGAHLAYGRDTFVTLDENFHKPAKRAGLAEIGVRDIARPDEVVGRFVCAGGDRGAGVAPGSSHE